MNRRGFLGCGGLAGAGALAGGSPSAAMPLEVPPFELDEATVAGLPAAVSGYPSLSVPMGFVFGLPVGLSFIGRAWSEPVLVRLAHAFEQATRRRKPPRFLTTAELSRPA